MEVLSSGNIGFRTMLENKFASEQHLLYIYTYGLVFPGTDYFRDKVIINFTKFYSVSRVSSCGKPPLAISGSKYRKQIASDWTDTSACSNHY